MKLLLVLLLLTSVVCFARDRNQVRHFRHDHPCPATGLARGACPGYVVDHVIPLCLGGPDHPTNMQWQDVQTAKAKDKVEMAICRQRRCG